jgi:HEAT repeat protein
MIEVGTDREGHSLRHLVWQGLKQCRTKVLFQFLHDRDVIVRSASARELQIRGGKLVFKETAQLLESDNKNIRELAAFILGQLGTPKRPFKAKSIRLLLRLLQSETNAVVRATAITSLGHLMARNAVEYVVSFAGDPSPSVRDAVTFAIGKIYCEKLDVLPTRIKRLLNKLCHDKSRDVRAGAKLAIELIEAKSKSY